MLINKLIISFKEINLSVSDYIASIYHDVSVIYVVKLAVYVCLFY